jgi:predicted acetyltransferase
VSAISNFLFGYKPLLCNSEIGLVLSDENIADFSCGIKDGYKFHVYQSRDRRKAGYVSLRLGDSPELFYLGHIGYRIEPEFRGHRYAAQACLLLVPFMRDLKLHSVVITNNADNVPSRRTCEILGCTLECIAQVPVEFRDICSGAKEKCRYILPIPRGE